MSGSPHGAVAAGDKEGVGRGDPRALRWGQTGATIWDSGRLVVDAAPRALANILGAVAKGLIHAEHKRVGSAIRDRPVDPVAPAAGKLDAEDADVGAREQGRREPITRYRFSIDNQGSRIG